MRIYLHSTAIIYYFAHVSTSLWMESQKIKRKTAHVWLRWSQREEGGDCRVRSELGFVFISRSIKPDIDAWDKVGKLELEEFFFAINTTTVGKRAGKLLATDRDTFYLLSTVCQLVLLLCRSHLQTSVFQLKFGISLACGGCFRHNKWMRTVKLQAEHFPPLGLHNLGASTSEALHVVIPVHPSNPPPAIHLTCGVSLVQHLMF